MKKITVLSGKGGVGKSTITASLAVTLSKRYSIVAADCDVDASNLAIVLGIKDLSDKKKISTNEIPEFDLEKCTSCKKCLDNCRFDAIWWDGKPALKKFGCEGCGVCKLVCPSDAIRLKPIDNAEIGTAKTKYGFEVVSGQLKIGESGSGKVVTAVRNLAQKNEKDIMLIDAAAGIGCPVIASVTGTDFVVCVTEPTPSGFEDLKRAIKVVEHFNIPYSIIINKFDLNIDKTKEIEQYAKEKKAAILARLPYDKNIVKALVNLTPIVIYDKSYEAIFEDIGRKLRDRLDLT